MKILYFYQYFTTPNGAWSTRVYEFARRCVQQGDSVTVVTSIYDKSDLRSDKLLSRQYIEGIDVRIINITLSNRHGFAQRIFTFLAYALVASWYALVLPADVVISSSGPISVAIPGLVARYLRGRRFVFEVRDLWPEGAIQLGVLRHPLAIRLARKFEQICYRSASQIVALSEGSANWISREYGIKDVLVVPNASDNHALDATRRQQLPDWLQSKTLVLYAGTIGLVNDCKQMVLMCEVLQRWGDSDIVTVLIGEGREREELEALACDLKLNNIKFLSQKPKHEIFGWLCQASCTLMLVRDVGVLSHASPNKIFDSFAAGVPVIQNSQGWIKDLFDREECGITVPQNDPEALAGAVLKLVREPNYREHISRNARRVGREQFDRDLLTERMRASLLAVAAAAK
jgi:glycosyltransferase involved in cell wall biosynthesis